MPIISEDGERDGILEAAKLMLLSARTAPKSAGIDDIVVAVVYGKEKERIAAEMMKIATERNIEGFQRDSKNTRDSEAVLLIGVNGSKPLGINCGACGYPNCDAFKKAGSIEGQDFTGPTCIFKALDMGIALGSAVKTASLLNVDSRIMYRVGTAARRLRLLPEANIIMGIPLSATGKSIYYDRPRKIKAT